MQKLINIFCLMLVGTSFAQQDPHFTQFFDNALFMNPAYAGSKEALSLTTVHREQWTGFDGRPKSSSLTAHTPLKYKSIGLGLGYVNDRLGPVSQNLCFADFSYTLRFKNKTKLAFGLKAGFNLLNIGMSELNTTIPDDPHLMNNVRNKMNPNFGTGIYYHNPKWFIGFSVPKLVENSYDGSENNLEKRHYYTHLGGVIHLDDAWILRPIAQVKFTEGAPVSVDASIAGVYRDKFYIGALYRLDAAFGAFVQYQLNPQFKIGFASDFGTQEIRNYNDGTFEVVLTYDFIFQNSGVRSPRYF